MKRECRAGKGHAKDQEYKHKSTDNGGAYCLSIVNEKSSSDGQTAKQPAVVKYVTGNRKPVKSSVKGQKSMTAYSGKANHSVCTKNDWISDSGASYHVCGSMEWFSSYEMLDDSNAPSISLADKSMIRPVGKGTVTLESYLGRCWI